MAWPYFCANREKHPNGEVIQIKTNKINPRCPYCGEIMTFGWYYSHTNYDY